MTLVIIILLATTSCAGFADGKQEAKQKFKLIDQRTLSEQWEDEILYFKPAEKTAPFKWNGLAYSSKDKVCYQLKQKPKATKLSNSFEAKVEATMVDCDKKFIDRATLGYEKFENFEKYKAKLVECLTTREERCLRGLISKTMKLSFDDDGFSDRRDLLFAQWKDSDYQRLKRLILKGVVSEDDDLKTFPPKPDEDGLGYRGHFERKNGSWVLASFVTGD